MMVTYFDLPQDATVISVMMLTVAPDLHALLWKGELRIVGAMSGRRLRDLLVHHPGPNATLSAAGGA